MTRGVRLGVDVGGVRVGFASSDPDGLIATPIETLARGGVVKKKKPRNQAPQHEQERESDVSDRDKFVTFLGEHGTIEQRGHVGLWPDDIVKIAQAALERDAQVIYVGLPRHLSGSEGAASADARTYAQILANAVAPIPVRLVDERMTTVTAHQALHASGRAGRKHRAVVDQVAAVIILQGALDRERSQGVRVGELVSASLDEGQEQV